MKKIVFFSFILVLALALRLWLVPQAWHVDIYSNAGWGEWIYDHSPFNFYRNNIWTYSWPTQPPLTNLVYAFCKSASIELLGRFAWVEYQVNKLLPGEKVPWLSDVVEWLAFGRVNIYIPFQINYLVTIKLIPIISDLIIAVLLYKITKKKLAAVLYLFFPFSWYISGLWGQFDSFGFLFVLLSALSLRSKKLAICGPALLAVAIFMKPTALIFLPIAGWIFLFRTSIPKWQKVVGLFLPFLIYYITTRPFTNDNLIEFTFVTLRRVVFGKSEVRVSVSAWNFWYLLTGGHHLNELTKFLFIPARYWSLLLLGVVNYLGISTLHKYKEKAYWYAWALVGFGSVFLSINMLERYFLAGIALLLIVAINYRKTLLLWLTMALIFSANLYAIWQTPEIPALKFLVLDAKILPRLLILILGICFVKIITTYKKKLLSKSS